MLVLVKRVVFVCKTIPVLDGQYLSLAPVCSEKLNTEHILDFEVVISLLMLLVILCISNFIQIVRHLLAHNQNRCMFDFNVLVQVVPVLDHNMGTNANVDRLPFNFNEPQSNCMGR